MYRASAIYGVPAGTASAALLMDHLSKIVTTMYECATAARGTDIMMLLKVQADLRVRRGGADEHRRPPRLVRPEPRPFLMRLLHPGGLAARAASPGLSCY